MIPTENKSEGVEKRMRKTYDKQVIKTLCESFKENFRPGEEKKEQLAKECNLTLRQVSTFIYFSL